MQTPDQPRSFKKRVLRWLGITNEVTVRVYHGYGYNQQLNIHGHVLRLSPIPRRKYRKSFVRNTLALLRLFIVKPFSGVKVRLQWNGSSYETLTDGDGFFRFEWQAEGVKDPGWHSVKVEALLNTNPIAIGEGSVFIPFSSQYGFISDIDDTFLVSHSSNLRKRLFVLFTQNARSRRPFEGAVEHYQLLSKGNTSSQHPNPFFYVSSSEWNLYDYILEFTRVHQIPEGVFLLNQLKLFSQLLKTGQSHHQTKFTRIARILEHYPHQKFILLGDSSQQDPYIYEAIVSHFPAQIFAVYIRDINRKNKQKASDVLKKIEGNGVHCCFFAHSSEAIEHSRSIGLIEK